MHQEKNVPIKWGTQLLSRLSSGDAFEKETSLGSSRRLLAKVILFLFYLFYPTYLKYNWSKIGAFKVYISRKTNGKTFVIDLTRTQFTVGGPF